MRCWAGHLTSDTLCTKGLDTYFAYYYYYENSIKMLWKVYMAKQRKLIINSSIKVFEKIVCQEVKHLI